jgi:hypothetical protein
MPVSMSSVLPELLLIIAISSDLIRLKLLYKARHPSMGMAA